ncbi:MAG TPA: hypothetical protein VGD78_16380, partial [Chthoniobacterales bacterium]
PSAAGRLARLASGSMLLRSPSIKSPRTYTPHQRAWRAWLNPQRTRAAYASRRSNTSGSHFGVQVRFIREPHQPRQFA